MQKKGQITVAKGTLIPMFLNFRALEFPVSTAFTPVCVSGLRRSNNAASYFLYA